MRELFTIYKKDYFFLIISMIVIVSFRLSKFKCNKMTLKPFTP